jgi:hypothetical protein
MHSKINGLTFLRKIHIINHGTLREVDGNYLFQQSYTFDFKENETPGN